MEKYKFKWRSVFDNTNVPRLSHQQYNNTAQRLKKLLQVNKPTYFVIEVKTSLKSASGSNERISKYTGSPYASVGAGRRG